MHDLILQECSILTLLPIFNDNGNASYGAQFTDYNTVLSPILEFYPTLTG
jgi:hypothetical protein